MKQKISRGACYHYQISSNLITVTYLFIVPVIYDISGFKVPVIYGILKGHIRPFGSPITSSDAETDLKPNIIIFYYQLANFPCLKFIHIFLVLWNSFIHSRLGSPAKIKSIQCTKKPTPQHLSHALRRLYNLR